MSRWDEIKESLFGPSREHWAEARRAIRSMRELLQIRKDEACVERLGARGYLNDAERLALYRKLLAKVKEHP